MSDDEPPREEAVQELSDDTQRKTGQKFQTPSPGYADRVFYESLLQQRPDSEMAQEWCVQYGVLPEERAAQLWKLICKRKAGGSPKKSSSSSSSSSSNSKPQKRPKMPNTIDGTSIVADTGEGSASFWRFTRCTPSAACGSPLPSLISTFLRPSLPVLSPLLNIYRSIGMDVSGGDEMIGATGI